MHYAMSVFRCCRSCCNLSNCASGSNCLKTVCFESETYRDTDSGLCSTSIYELHLHALLSPSLMHLCRQLQCICQIHAQLQPLF